MAALTYESAKENAWRGCPKRGNSTYHIVPMNSKPVTHQRVTGSVCAYANEQLNLLNGDSSGAVWSFKLGKVSSQKHSLVRQHSILPPPSTLLEILCIVLVTLGQ